MKQTDRPARRRTNNPEAMRGRILDAASELFQAQGYHATTTQDIMAKAQVTGGALHHHFPTKKALGLAVVRERVAKAVEETWIDPVLVAKRGIDGVLAVFDSLSAALREQGYVRGCPLNNLAIEMSYADADFRREIQEIFGQWRAALAGRLKADQQAGWRPDLDVVRCASFIVAAYSGSIAMAKAEQTEEALVTTRAMLAAQFA